MENNEYLSRVYINLVYNISLINYEFKFHLSIEARNYYFLNNQYIDTMMHLSYFMTLRSNTVARSLYFFRHTIDGRAKGVGI